MADGLRIIVNGRERLLESLAEQESLQGVLAALELKADRIAVEHNGEIASRASWPSTPVMSGDRLEVVHFVGGGVGLQKDRVFSPRHDNSGSLWSK